MRVYACGDALLFQRDELGDRFYVPLLVFLARLGQAAVAPVSFAFVPEVSFDKPAVAAEFADDFYVVGKPRGVER